MRVGFVYFRTVGSAVRLFIMCELFFSSVLLCCHSSSLLYFGLIGVLLLWSSGNSIISSM